MSIAQAFLEALESLSGNKLRSGLTVLGIVIGVAAVIAMLAVGRGAEASITGSISGIGTNLLFVFRGDPGDNIRNPKPLTTEDANARRVAVFRTIDGQRKAAAFDLSAIRHGQFQDPQIYPGDIVVVDGSAIKEGFKRIMQSFPLFSVFTAL